MRNFKSKSLSGWSDNDTNEFVSSIELRFWSPTGEVVCGDHSLTWFRRKTGLRSLEQWEKYCRGELPGYKPKPDDIPAYPYDIYKNKGWTSVGDWLGRTG